jgi:hypothetical protein
MLEDATPRHTPAAAANLLALNRIIVLLFRGFFGISSRWQTIVAERGYFLSSV